MNDYNLLTNLGEENYLEIITYQQEDIITTQDTTI